MPLKEKFTNPSNYEIKHDQISFIKKMIIKKYSTLKILK